MVLGEGLGDIVPNGACSSPCWKVKGSFWRYCSSYSCLQTSLYPPCQKSQSPIRELLTPLLRRGQTTGIGLHIYQGCKLSMQISKEIGRKVRNFPFAFQENCLNVLDFCPTKGLPMLMGNLNAFVCSICLMSFTLTGFNLQNSFP